MVLYRMLRRESVLRAHLSLLNSVFTQTTPLTSLSSAFTKPPGYIPPRVAFPVSSKLSKPSNVQRANALFASRMDLRDGARVFNRLRTLFCSGLRVVIIFNNLRTLCIVKIRLSPTESIIPALFSKNTGYGYPPTQLVIPTERGICFFSKLSSLQTGAQLTPQRMANCSRRKQRQESRKKLPKLAIRCQTRTFRCNTVQYLNLSTGHRGWGRQRRFHFVGTWNSERMKGLIP